MPVITNDNPPMNEIVKDGVNGLLVTGAPERRGQVGDPGLRPQRPRPEARRSTKVRDPELRARLRQGALAERERLDWRHTVDGLRAAGRAGRLDRARGAARARAASSRCPWSARSRSTRDARNLEADHAAMASAFGSTTPEPIEMREGALISYRLSLHRIPRALATPDRDLGAAAPVRRRASSAGPYALWHHTHELETRGERETVMRDRVRYRIGFGPARAAWPATLRGPARSRARSSTTVGRGHRASSCGQIAAGLHRSPAT